MRSPFLSIAVFATLLVCPAARAFTVGDRADFSEGQNEYRVEVIETRSSSQIGIEQSWGEVRPPLTSWLSEAQIEEALIGFSATKALEYFDRCLELGGRIETLVVPAGRFEACTFQFAETRDSYSVSPSVPLGIVRKQSREWVWSLKSYRFGEPK